jgi:hypothetical protein
VTTGGTELPRREVPPAGMRDAANREKTPDGTRPALGWVTDPGTLRRVRDALALLVGGSHVR